jgi:hypothetical protein
VLWGEGQGNRIGSPGLCMSDYHTGHCLIMCGEGHSVPDDFFRQRV